MVKSDIIDALARTPEERLLLAQAAEKAALCRERCYLTNTKFLDLHEAELVRRYLEASGETCGRLWGGYDRAERRLAIFLPDYMDALPTEAEDCPLAVLRCSKNKGDDLSHRDYLGSLMGLGLQRSSFGDILVGEHGADILVLRELVPFLLMNYGKAGRKHVSVSEVPLSALIVPEEKVTYVRDTVASLRLDSITSALFRISRSKAADAIRAGKVFVNQQACTRVDKEVTRGDRITLRGSGRGEVDDIMGESKKGRIIVSLKLFG